jgi:hypothetical protein
MRKQSSSIPLRLDHAARDLDQGLTPTDLKRCHWVEPGLVCLVVLEEGSLRRAAERLQGRNSK